MAIIYPTTDIVTIGNGLDNTDFADGDVIVIGEDIDVVSTGNRGISSSYQTTSVDVHGLVAGNFFGIFLFTTDDEIAFNYAVTVSSTGAVTSGDGNGAAISLGSNQSPTLSVGTDIASVINAGTVTSHKDVGVSISNAEEGRFINSGIVQTIGDLSTSRVLSMINVEYAFIHNSGELLNGAARSIASGNTLTATVYVSGSGTIDFFNEGTISGPGLALSMSLDNGGTGDVVNAGVINGDLDFAGGGTFDVTNSGYIDGDIDFVGSSGASHVKNSGEITGDIIFRNTDDKYLALNDGVTGGTVMGDAGADTLVGGNSDDRFNGGDNADRLVGNDGNDNLLGGGSGDVIRGGDGNDFIDGEGGVDDVRGGNGADEVLGGIGDDTVRGGAGDDIVDGGKGNDDVRGGSGDDDVIGGLNKDQLFGGSGRDVFIFREEADSTNDSNRDFIKDFDIGEDLIDLSLLPGVLTFVGSSGFSGTAREVRVVENSAGNSVIYVDVDGDGTGDMRIIAEGVTGLSESDFIL